MPGRDNCNGILFNFHCLKDRQSISRTEDVSRKMSSKLLKDLTKNIPAAKTIITPIGIAEKLTHLGNNIDRDIQHGMAPTEARVCQTLKTATILGTGALLGSTVLDGGINYARTTAEQTMRGDLSLIPGLIPIGALMTPSYNTSKATTHFLGDFVEEGCHSGFNIARGLSNGSMSFDDLSNNAARNLASICKQIPGCPTFVTVTAAALTAPSLIRDVASKSNQASSLAPKP